MSNPVQRVADVVTFPVRTVAGTAVSAATGAVRVARDWSTYAVDDWGRDPDFVRRAVVAGRLRWRTSVGGTEHLPTRGGALIVVNARSWALAPVFAALALGDRIDRPVRFVGRPDIAPIGPLMQRLGGLLPIEGELEGVLRAGELVVLGAAHHATNAVAGTIDHRLVGAAVAAKVKVIPGATLSTPLRRSARVELGPPVRPTRIRRGPLAELELADLAEQRIDAMLVELGGSLTGTPLDWLPLDRLPAGLISKAWF